MQPQHLVRPVRLTGRQVGESRIGRDTIGDEVFQFPGLEPARSVNEIRGFFGGFRGFHRLAFTSEETQPSCGGKENARSSEIKAGENNVQKCGRSALPSPAGRSQAEVLQAGGQVGDLEPARCAGWEPVSSSLPSGKRRRLKRRRTNKPETVLETLRSETDNCGEAKKSWITVP